MTRVHRTVALLPFVVAVSLFAVGCGSSSTGPQTTPSQYAGSYQGIVAGAGGSGTVAITVGQVSSDVTRGPVLHAEGGNPDAVSVTLATSSGSIVLTGTISGNMATVTSTTPPATCTITFTTTGASGSCTEAPYGTLSLIAFVLVNGIEATAYCGTQSAGASAAVNPTATLGAVVSGPNMYLVVAPPTGTAGLYSGTISGNNVSLTSTSSGGAVYSGTVSGTASIGGTITSGGTGSWLVANPCVQGALTFSTSAVPVSANVGSTATITLTPVAISNGGGSGTLGVLGVGTTAYTPSATSGWLQAALTSPTTTGGTLSLSVTPPSGIAAGSYAAVVPITASLGTNSPQTVAVTLTVSAAQAPGLSENNPSMTFQLMQGASAPGGNTDQISVTGGAVPLAVGITYPTGQQAWLTATFVNGATSVSPGSPVLLSVMPTPAVSSFNAGQYTATIQVTTTTPGVAPVSISAQLNVTSTSQCIITTSPTLPALTVGTVADVLLTTVGPCPTTGSNSWTVTGGSLPAGLSIPLGGTLPEIYGTPTTSGIYGVFTINLVNSVAGNVTFVTFNGGTVLPATVCEIGPNPEPNGTAGVLYAQGFVASNNCTSASDDKSLWSWSVSTGLPPGLTFDNPIVGVNDVGLTGTPAAGDAGVTYTFTVTFTNANQVAGHNEASASQVYNMTINPAPAGDRVRTAVTRAGSLASPRVGSQ